MGLKHKGGKWKPLLKPVKSSCHKLSVLGTWLQAVNAGFVCILEGMRVGDGLGVCRAKSKNPMGTLGKGWWSRRGKGHHRGGMVLIMVVPKTQEPFLSAQMTGYSRD